MTTLLEQAKRIAAAEHARQRRHHGTPYLEHPAAVAALTHDLGQAAGFAPDEQTIALAWLHDVIEDGTVDEATLARQVGRDVARGVALLSKPPCHPGLDAQSRHRAYQERLLREADDAIRLVKVADRLHNLSELHLAPGRPDLGPYLADTRRFIVPLAQQVSSPPLRRGLLACLVEATALAARLQHVDAPEIPRWRAAGPRGLYALVNAAANTDPDLVRARAQAAIEGGATFLQLRCKQLSDRAMLAHVEATLPLARRYAVPLLVNDRADIARVAGADGVHVGQTDLTPTQVRALLSPDAKVGQSSHDEAEAAEVLTAQPVDYLAFGPIFLSSTKAGHAPPTGLDALRRVAARSHLPVCAIGGIQGPQRMAEVARAGAALGAVVAALERADDPRLMARRLSLAHLAAAPFPPGE